MESNYITPAEFAKRMNFHLSTVRRWILEGRIKSLTIKNPHRNHYRIPLSEVERFEREAISDMSEF